LNLSLLTKMSGAVMCCVTHNDTQHTTTISASRSCSVDASTASDMSADSGLTVSLFDWIYRG